MRKAFALIISILLLTLCAACGEKASEASTPVQNSETAASSQEQAGLPAESSATEDAASAESAASEESTISEESAAPEESSAESVAEPAEPEATVTMQFDTHLYENTNNDTTYNALAYGTNSGDTPAEVTVQYQAFDEEGNALSVTDMFWGKTSDKFITTLYIPAGVKDLPLGFSLTAGLKYDANSGEDMPEIAHVDYEILGVKSIDTEDLREHFTPGELEDDGSHIRCYVKFDQEIGDNYASLYPDYTLLGYLGDELAAVSSTNYFPSGTSSMSVSYAKENNDSSMLVYHRTPDAPVDRWELYLGCIAGE